MNQPSPKPPKLHLDGRTGGGANAPHHPGDISNRRLRFPEDPFANAVIGEMQKVQSQYFFRVSVPRCNQQFVGAGAPVAQLGGKV